MILNGVQGLTYMLIRLVSVNISFLQSLIYFDCPQNITLAGCKAVNVNIWLSLEGANLDEDSGGLVVYTTKPPGELKFHIPCSFYFSTWLIGKPFFQTLGPLNLIILTLMW